MKHIQRGLGIPFRVSQTSSRSSGPSTLCPHDARGGAQIGRPVCGERRSAGLAVEQRHTWSFFDFEDVSTERCLLNIEVARCLAEATGVGRRDQVTGLAKFYQISNSTAALYQWSISLAGL